MEEGMATHSSILAWEVPWTDEPRGLHTVHGALKEAGMTEQVGTHASVQLTAMR